jgi:hypothetical protein
MGSGAVGLLAVGLIFVLSPMVWRDLQQGRYSTDAGTTLVAEGPKEPKWTAGNTKTRGSQPSPGSLQIPSGQPRSVTEVDDTRKGSALPLSGNVTPSL